MSAREVERLSVNIEWLGDGALYWALRCAKLDERWLFEAERAAEGRRADGGRPLEGLRRTEPRSA